MININTIDNLVEQAIQANVRAYRKAEKDYYYWTEALTDPEWKELDIPAMCRIHLKYCVRQSG